MCLLCSGVWLLPVFLEMMYDALQFQHKWHHVHSFFLEVVYSFSSLYPSPISPWWRLIRYVSFLWVYHLHNQWCLFRPSSYPAEAMSSTMCTLWLVVQFLKLWVVWLVSIVVLSMEFQTPSAPSGTCQGPKRFRGPNREDISRNTQQRGDRTRRDHI